eukprot:8632465-Pyramimonas_sp.AAC.1
MGLGGIGCGGPPCPAAWGGGGGGVAKAAVPGEAPGGAPKAAACCWPCSGQAPSGRPAPIHSMSSPPSSSASRS